MHMPSSAKYQATFRIKYTMHNISKERGWGGGGGGRLLVMAIFVLGGRRLIIEGFW